MHVFSWGHPAELIPHYGCGLCFPECEDLQTAWQILSFLVLQYYWDSITNPSFYRKPQHPPSFFLTFPSKSLNTSIILLLADKNINKYTQL